MERQYVPNRRGARCQALRVWLPLTAVPFSSVDLVVQWEFVLLGVRAPQAVSCLGTGGAEKGTWLQGDSHLLLLRESIPRQVDKKSGVPKKEKGAWGSRGGDRGLEFSRRKKRQTSFFPSTFLSLSHIKHCFSLSLDLMITHLSLTLYQGLYNNNVSCLWTVFSFRKTFWLVLIF